MSRCSICPLGSQLVTPFKRGQDLFNRMLSRVSTNRLRASLFQHLIATPKIVAEQFTNEDTRKHDSKSESNGPPQMVSKTIQPAGIVINDAAYHGIEISGADTCVENFPGFDFSSAGVINTSAFRGAKITGGRVSNFGRASSA